MQKSSLSQNLVGDAILLFVTFCWGITFPLIKDAVAHVNPAVFVTTRFFLSAILLLPLVFKDIKNLCSKQIIKSAMLLGIFNAIGYLSQTIGLKTLSSAQGAFITGLYVIIVPFLMPLFSLGRPDKKDFFLAVLCLLGLFTLIGDHFSAMQIGVVWVLCAAVAIAISILCLQRVSLKISSTTILAFYQIVFTGLFVSPFSIHQNFVMITSPVVIVALLFCAIFATCLALVLQAKYQRYTTANRAAMIYCMEPIFGAFFGYVINGEVISSRVFLGGLLILSGIVISECYPLISKLFLKVVSKQRQKFAG